ncbi:M56 family metallopeptidase [Winogradskyella sp.]|uniref:M56 family metallopeptidase n=1 Tax=Winogradskyella sp. TaxID=1883156 RepID=UPI00261FB446|nr:M56 family metallopeptidase [Winogradskyella sp.]
MHRFKRYYLLGTVVMSLIIPLLTITYYVEPVVSDFEDFSSLIPPIGSSYVETAIAEEPSIDLETILWSIYTIGVIIFFGRFVINIINLTHIIAKSEKISEHPFIYVLLHSYRIPHSFFKYIFLNKQRFENKGIPNEVLLHEQTHAKQLHSMDILLLELLQIVFWFHPLIYVLKHHVKLNHEFLADAAVLNQGTDPKNYQNILLQFSSSTQNQQLASAINYSSFKKRFTVMKTQTSKTKMWLSTMLLLPIVAILFYSFAERKEVIKSVEDLETNLFLVTVEKNNNTIELRCETGCKWSHITLEPKATPYIINDYGFSNGSTIDSDKFAFSIKPTEVGVELNGLNGTAWVDLAFSLRKNKRQAINQLGMTSIPPSPLKKERKAKVLNMKATNNTLFIGNKKSSLSTYVEDLNDITSNWTSEDFEITYLDLETQNCSEEFLSSLNELHKKTDHFLITVLGTKNDVVKAYNKKYEVYKKLQDTPPHFINKTENEQKKMEALFSDLGGMYFRMSKANKAKVKRPISPVRPYTKITLNGKTYYKKYEDLTEEEKATLPPPPPPIKKSKGGPNFGNPQETYNPSFLEYIIEMEQLGASFYLDDNKITPEKARSIAKNNKGKRTDMLTQKDANGKYIVKLSNSTLNKTEYAIINNIPLNDVGLELSKSQLRELKVTLKRYDVSGFKIMFPDNNPIKVKGKVLTESIKSRVDDLIGNQIVTIFDIENSGNLDIPPVLILINDIQESATKQQITEYNTWARKINTAVRKAEENDDVNAYPIVKQKEVEHYMHIYKNLMTDEQRKNAEAWPKFPPAPPKPPKPPKDQKSRIKEMMSVKRPEPPKPVKALRTEEKKQLKKQTKALMKERSEKLKKLKKETKNTNVKSSNTPDDYTIRKLILKVSKRQTKPLSYRLNGKKSSAEEIENYILKYPESDVRFDTGNTNSTLTFSNKKGAKMSYNDLQKIYNAIFKNYEQETEKIIARPVKSQKSKGGPNPISYDETALNDFELKKTYLKKYAEYEAMRHTKPHFVKKSKEQKKKMSDLWVELRQMYFFSLSKDEKKNLKLPITPFAPYVKILKDGKSYYKVNKHLTEEELKVSSIFNKRETDFFPGLDLLDKNDPIVIPIGTYKLEKESVKNEDGRRKVFISISEDGTYKISKDGSLKNFNLVSLNTLESLVAKLSELEKTNTFVFSDTKDFKKFRSKPSKSPEYQDDIEVILIKDDIRFNTMEINGKFREHPIYQLVLNNDTSEILRSHVAKLGELFKKYGISNLTL